MIATNAKLTLPHIFSSISSQKGDNVAGRINWYISYVDWGINYAGWIVGLKSYWRMFSPVDRFNWDMVVTAVHEDGAEILLPLPHQTDRNFWERNFIDFREAKFQLNIYNNKTAQRWYAEYLCRTYQQEHNPVTAIKIKQHSQMILSPQEAERRDIYFEPTVTKRLWGTFACSLS